MWNNGWKKGSIANKACPSSRDLFSHVVMLITKGCPITFVFLDRDV
jgi:hypothetical protein